jgi:hypothetical protein
LKDYKVVILGDREFCSVHLGNWLRQQFLYFCLRLKKNEFVLVKAEIWLQLSELGLAPGTSFYLEGVKVTKQKGFDKFNVAAKWKRKYRGWAPNEGWFILTNLDSLSSAITAYQKRFDIEEMCARLQEWRLQSGGHSSFRPAVNCFNLTDYHCLLYCHYRR